MCFTRSYSKGSRLRQIFGKKRLGVDSFHHQAVKTTGRDFTITAVSDDGVPEALEYAGERFALGVQWHPEMMKNSAVQQKIFRAFVGACKGGRKE